ncbi:MAG: MiaB/RimO family radical SAM methylthiotransferase [Candidatus Omnitrophica bacterium]|nr:MiaB/RimO family radical SAM methylthiotransferase [Candidatus Omnitrophota bacterium]MBU4303853.1 MiaB/RimO family radical SAM methylthiotransferase [Candidatus Omnitrophota bacterium]
MPKINPSINPSTLLPSTSLGMVRGMVSLSNHRINGEPSRTIKFFTLGCKANQYDTQSIRERFLSKGFKEAAQPVQPDYFLVNTCTVTSGADQKSRNIIRRCIQAAPGARVIVTGCLAEKDASQLKRIKGIGLIIKKSFFPESISSFSQHTRAFLKIQDGCSNFCTYCKVALVRGGERSKKLKQILQEARQLVACGHKEIVLTGICLGAYGRSSSVKENLVDVVGCLEKIKGLARIRLSSIEASDVSPGLIKYMRHSKKLCRHLHIPMQSGDNHILKLMNRKFSRKKYENLISRLKLNIPGISITTDCLVGFPGETEDSFQNTIDLVRKIMPLKVHIFPYSSRPQTKAAKFKGVVNSKTIRLRCKQLAEVAKECRKKFMQEFLDQNVDVLIEGKVKDNPELLEGLTDNYLKVKLPFRPGLGNLIVRARLKSIRGDSFIGEYVDNIQF